MPTASRQADDDLAKRTENVVLVLNAGSSSLRFAVFEGNAMPHRIFSGKFDRIGSAKSALMTPTERTEMPVANHVAALEHLLNQLAAKEFCAVGHRVVHGGANYRHPQRVDGAMLTELRRISAFDPEHLPAAIALMAVLAAKFPHLPQIACFDTAFHSAMPRVAKLLPIPRRYEAQGVQRYGFHGLSYEYLMSQPGMHGRVILAHLGNGASMAAVRDGQPVDTSMAFTPTAGLMMGRRSGDIDPGLIAFLARSEQMTAARFTQMVNHESGLLGVSETSSDMRDLLAHESADVRAAEAVALFCYLAKKWIGAYAAALGGLDTLVFTGGIGENMPAIRGRICDGLEFLGIELDEQQNAANASVISRAASRVAVRVIRTDEEIVIARSVHLLEHGGRA
ncbi:MAG: putative propionate kinase [Verrucomicrobiae bacterium]|nr:putative propionate kinase [Verrucomicrobiae bacterium]